MKRDRHILLSLAVVSVINIALLFFCPMNQFFTTFSTICIYAILLITIVFARNKEDNLAVLFIDSLNSTIRQFHFQYVYDRDRLVPKSIIGVADNGTNIEIKK
jgi:hypothetical protein